MKTLDHQAVNDLYVVVGAIQAAKRLEVADEIRRLQSVLGSKDDLFADRRKLAWAPGGKARLAVETKPKKPCVTLTTRGGWGSTPLTLEEAAKQIGLRPSTLNVYLSRGRGRYDCTIDNDIITVQRL